MAAIDDSISVAGETTTLRRLATESRIILRQSGSFNLGGAAEPRKAWWADLVDVFAEPRIHIEISEADYVELKNLDVPETTAS